jgi:hypothetical protein
MDARASNAESAITGMLLYSDGNFMQMLEGPRESLDDAMARIHRSKLHSDVTILVDEPVSVREFESWSMAFKRAHAEAFLAMRQASWVREGDQLTQGREILRDFWRNSRSAS